jgi:rhodanese-related sulfurtransferase
MKFITTEELSKYLESGTIALFDVRGDVEFDQGHIPGARSAPLGSLSFRVADVMNPDSRVFVYSQNSDSPLATEAAERLKNLGLRNIYCYQGGIDDWRRAGHSAIQSAVTRTHTWGPVTECRPIIVDRDRAYNGAFRGEQLEVEGAGG